ncbi:MAG TPA: ribosome silencing factor [Saprospiraceae bacterium]|nr:ribosome silencing factor [Saprospiraceae bacterium]HMQ83316.1 ribosome silencing factor [Saprospiraceae bacterium]
MNSQINLQQRKLTTAELNDLIIDSIQDIKGKNIVKLDLRHLHDAPTDYFIICEGDSNTQVKAICDNIRRRLKNEAGTLPSHSEGERNALWICMDYFHVAVHIFYRETRKFYELEELWSDARFTTYEDL